MFEHVGERYRRIRMQLLATGGTDKHDASQPRWKMRTYPERFSFIQTVRAWAKWRDHHPKLDCRLALHVVLDSVYLDIASGRIDVLELLSCKDIRFFVEVVSETGEIERRLLQMMPETKLDEVVGYLRLSRDHWTVELTPPPSLEKPSESLRERLKLTLLQLGVIPGSTLHFRRVKRGAPVLNKTAAKKKGTKKVTSVA